jgi:hypothetical protein
MPSPEKNKYKLYFVYDRNEDHSKYRINFIDDNIPVYKYQNREEIEIQPIQVEINIQNDNIQEKILQESREQNYDPKNLNTTFLVTIVEDRNIIYQYVISLHDKLYFNLDDGNKKFLEAFVLDDSLDDRYYTLGKSLLAEFNQIFKDNNQNGGSLYDKKGKLLYRGEMKNGLPHGYGTGYYANGKVGHVGMFKGGKIVQ